MPHLTARSWLATGALTAGLGAALGVLWWLWAPRVLLDVYGEATYPADYQPSGYITDEGIAAVLCIAGGLVTFVIAGFIARRDRVTWLDLRVLAISIISGLLGAGALWWVGTSLGSVDIAAAIAEAGDGGSFLAPLELRIPGIALMWPLASAVAFAVTAVIAWIIDRGR